MTDLYWTRPVAPVRVEARQVTTANAEEIAEWCDAIAYTGNRHGHTTPPWTWHTCITLFEPEKVASPGDWVVRYPDGKFDVYARDEFAAAFEKDGRQ